MKIMIKEKKQIRELSIYGTNGIEWTADLLGNNDALQYDQEREIYIMSQSDYFWWLEYINNHINDEKEIQELAEELDIDISEIYERISQYSTCDLGDEHNIKQAVLKEIKNENKKVNIN
jgi:hypothetical protein